MYAEILIEYPTKKIDKYFTYIIPSDLQGKVKKGMKVKIPFGTKIINGFVMNVMDSYECEYELKEIIQIVDEELLLNEELMNLGMYLQEKTLCPLISAYQTMLPSSLKIKDNDTNYKYFKSYIILNKSKEEINEYLNTYKKENKQTILLKELLDKDKLLKKDYSDAVINALVKKELIKVIKEQEYRINKENNYNLVKHELNEEQNNAFNTIKNTNNFEVYLLEGITGSGKTEVYLNLINEVIKNGKEAIMLVPEITLTAQIVNRFYDWFGSKVAILHSALSSGEKYDEYLKIIRGEVSVVVGTRSAIFAPFNNLGIVIIDEEHSDSFKQDNMPRYNAIDIAKERCKYYNIPLVLGSATPTLETRARAIKGVYKHLFLTKRVGSSNLPTVKIVDMMEEVKKGNFIFSDELVNKMKEVINNDEQVILLLNRRGYSTTVNCSYCGYTYKCPNCDITLTYHKSTDNLRCHYCGYTIKKSNTCPNCHEQSLTYLGLGTEKVETELQKILPEAKIIRMDQDTTSKKGAHEKIIESFKNKEYNILLGTQMISKGLDFPYVTLVGIINADTSLNVPDFRGNERTFALLYQASGRAGRSGLKSNVLIQTYNPDNQVLNFVKDNDFNSFYKYEMDIRRMLKYPPYYYLVGLKIISSDYNLVLENATKIGNYLKSEVEEETIVLGPTTASIFRINNNYHFQIVIKYRFDNKLMEILKYLDSIYINDNKVNLEIDIDPLHI